MVRPPTAIKLGPLIDHDRDDGATGSRAIASMPHEDLDFIPGK